MEYFEIDDEGSPLRYGEELESAEKQLEASMRFAYSVIEAVGPEEWAAHDDFVRERKINILNNMIKWHIDPDREEYEKAALLKRALDQLEGGKS